MMIEAAREAGDEIERIYGAGCATEWKADGSPVTEADRAAEAIILRRLNEAHADVPVLAEEAACEGPLPALGSRFFLVDPLDGTRGFVERNGEFTVNIALIEAGAAVAGVVYAPDARLLYAGEIGEGALRSRYGGEFEQIAARSPPAEGLTAVASRSDTEATRHRIAHMEVARFVPSSSSLKFCLLAEGIADLYPRFGPTMEWDTGAGQAVLEAAGGRVLALDGEGEEAGPLRYGKVDAGFRNPHFMAWGCLNSAI
jgi:3'(2'), 5'-bisphosphate nucleotidase